MSETVSKHVKRLPARISPMDGMDDRRKRFLSLTGRSARARFRYHLAVGNLSFRPSPSRLIKILRKALKAVSFSATMIGVS